MKRSFPYRTLPLMFSNYTDMSFNLIEIRLNN